MFDPAAATPELVRALRGERSQAALCRRLRYASNVVHLWESGRRTPTLAAAFWLAHRVGVDVQAGLDRLLPTRSREAEAPWTVAGAARLLRDVQGGRTATALGQALGRNRQSVGRWLRGDAEPDLPDAIALVQACTARGLDFLAVFVDPAALPSTADAWRRLGDARALVRERPWSAAVLLALELEGYRRLPRHEPGWIAARLGLPAAVEAESLDLLAAAGHIRDEGGRWAPVGGVLYDVNTPERSVDLRRWWAGVSLERTRPGPGCSGAWHLFTCSEADFQRMRELQKEFFRELRTLAAASGPMERLVLAQMQLVVLADGA